MKATEFHSVIQSEEGTKKGCLILPAEVALETSCKVKRRISAGCSIPDGKSYVNSILSIFKNGQNLLTSPFPHLSTLPGYMHRAIALKPWALTSSTADLLRPKSTAEPSPGAFTRRWFHHPPSNTHFSCSILYLFAQTYAVSSESLSAIHRWPHSNKHLW